MPGVYKEKECPYCGTKHRKRGKYCSASHAQLARAPQTEEHKQNISDALKEKYSDPNSEAYHEAQMRGKNMADVRHGNVRDPVPPRQHIDRPGEVIDGDVWFSDDDLF